MIRAGLPCAKKGQVVGLLGGSFDPAHRGHVHITHEALKRLKLDQVWWLVTPENPLKKRHWAPLGRRVLQAQELVRHPRVVVSDIEKHLGVTQSALTITRLKRLYRGVHFVWLIGSDNLLYIHRWYRWRDIFALVPVVAFARPKANGLGGQGLATCIFRDYRISKARTIVRKQAPAWAFVNIPMCAVSSTALRNGAYTKRAE